MRKFQRANAASQAYTHARSNVSTRKLQRVPTEGPVRIAEIWVHAQGCSFTCGRRDRHRREPLIVGTRRACGRAQHVHAEGSSVCTRNVQSVHVEVQACTRGGPNVYTPKSSVYTRMVQEVHAEVQACTRGGSNVYTLKAQRVHAGRPTCTHGYPNISEKGQREHMGKVDHAYTWQVECAHAEGRPSDA
jgi:hypothetical protein